MSLIVIVEKIESDKMMLIIDKMSQLCEGILETEINYHYIPLRGNLIEILKVLNEYGIRYKISSEPFELNENERSE
jgi:hypothetical protein